MLLNVLKMFPGRLWNLGGLQKLVRKIDERGSADRHLGSGRPRTSRSSTKIEEVEELAVSQEESPTAIVHNDKLHAKPVYLWLLLTL